MLAFLAFLLVPLAITIRVSAFDSNAAGSRPGKKPPTIRARHGLQDSTSTLMTSSLQTRISESVKTDVVVDVPVNGLSFMPPKGKREAEKRQNVPQMGLGVPCAPAKGPQYVQTTEGGDQVCLPFPGNFVQAAKLTKKRSILDSLFRRRTSIAIQPHVSEERRNGDLTMEKREDSKLLQAFKAQQAAGRMVRVDSASLLYWQREDGTLDTSRGLAVDLCGGTAVIITSSTAIIVMHLKEERAEGNMYYKSPGGELQIAADEEFTERAKELAEVMLGGMLAPDSDEAQLSGSNNDWNGWFKPSDTTVTIVAPQYDPEGIKQEEIPQELLHYLEKGGYVHANQPGRISNMMKKLIARRSGAAPRITKWPYRHRTVYQEPQTSPNDDRHRLVVTIRPDDGFFSAFAYFDDDKEVKINNLAKFREVATV